MMMKSLLIAKRGEIACRVIRTARLWDDGIVAPAQTRDVLGLALGACLNARVEEAPRFGVFRI